MARYVELVGIPCQIAVASYLHTAVISEAIGSHRQLFIALAPDMHLIILGTMYCTKCISARSKMLVESCDIKTVAPSAVTSPMQTYIPVR